MKHEGSHAPNSVPRLILRYLAQNPQAADSAEGIRRWWLGSFGDLATQAEVERALARLVGQGRMRRVSLADGTLLYSREPNSANTAH